MLTSQKARSLEVVPFTIRGISNYKLDFGLVPRLFTLLG